MTSGGNSDNRDNIARRAKAIEDSGGCSRCPCHAGENGKSGGRKSKVTK